MSEARPPPPGKVATYSPRDGVDPLNEDDMEEMPVGRDEAPTRSPARNSQQNSSASQRTQRMHEDRRAQEERAEATAEGRVAPIKGSELLAGAREGATFGQDIARKELERRWRAAQEEEDKLRITAMNIERMEKQLAMVRGRDTPNFPPSICCIRPLVHHDINGDIPLERQRFVRTAWYNFIITVILLIANAVIAIVNAVMPDKVGVTTDDVSQIDQDTYKIHFVLSIVYLLGIVFAFIVWYWPLYKACATGNSLSYVLAFLGLGIAFGFSVLSSVGLLGYGGCGFLYAYFTQSLKGEALFIVTIVMAAMWVVQAVVFVAFIFFLRGWYKEDKASLASAKSQFTRGAARTAVTLA